MVLRLAVRVGAAARPPAGAALQGQRAWKTFSDSQRYGEIGEGGGLKMQWREDPDVPVPLLHTCTKRVKHLRRAIDFYQRIFDFEVLHTLKLVQAGYSMVYIGPRVANKFTPARAQSSSHQLKVRNPNDALGNAAAPSPGTLDAHDYLFHSHGTCLEFIHFTHEEENHHYTISSGNDPKHLGFGGVNILVEDLAQVCRRLHGLKYDVLAEPTPADPSVLVLDPDGYAVRITERKSTALYDMRMRPDMAKLNDLGITLDPAAAKPPPSVINQIRLRVKNPRASVPFYEEFFDMRVVCVRKCPDLEITRYYMVCRQQVRLESADFIPLPKDPYAEEAWDFVQSFRVAFLELQHHHGVEDAEGFTYHSGNTPPLGFGHLGFLVRDVEEVIEKCVKLGIFVIKNKGEGAFPQSGYIMDPDGYWIEIYPRCMRDIIAKQPEAESVPERWGT
eukprot:TRINITY_DN8906_c0_g2_i3.p1 TRINITY_DN8906_c0_g2~~TRINITY_DN8906_c0_g2_i3.p1  ORF type:complete len:446 (+),score=136.94 TRINITY_DN8906_c0_g2_i3:108-1445(+)